MPRTAVPFEQAAVEAYLRSHFTDPGEIESTREEIRRVYREQSPDERDDFMQYLAREARANGAVVTLPATRTQ